MREPPDDISRHTFPIEHFDAIAAGGGGADAIRLLRRSELSRRLLLLRELLDLAEDQASSAGGLPAPSVAWDLLAQLSAQAPTSFAAMLDHPQVGTWLSHSVRRGLAEAPGKGSSWVETGQLYAIILAIAIRAGLPIQVPVPVRHGRLMLPTLGMVRFPSVEGFGIAAAQTAAGVCRIRLDRHEVELPADLAVDTPYWWCLRRLQFRSHARTLTIFLDDIDPYRSPADPIAPDRLDDAAFGRWRDLLAGAWNILAERHPTVADGMTEGLTSIAPLAQDPSWLVRSASTGDGFSAATMSLPPDPVTLAMTMTHEFQHIKLGGLLHLFTLIHSDATAERLYAPWRPDPRPLAGLLQGVYAFFGITGFWRRQREAGTVAQRRLADFEFTYAHRQTWKGLRVLVRTGQLTELGQRLVEGVTGQLRSWRSGSWFAESRRVAWAAAADHRAGWRIRHVAVDPEWVTSAVRAWTVGGPPPPAPPEVINGAGPVWTHDRLTMYRHKLAGTEQRPRPVTGSAGDAPLIEGDHHQATAAYLARIAKDPTDLDAWTGLGLALAADAGQPEWRPFLRNPELVYALYVGLAGERSQPSPRGIARWLERASTAQVGRGSVQGVAG